MAVKKSRANAQPKPPKTPADALRAALAAGKKTEAARDDLKAETNKVFAEARAKVEVMRADYDKKVSRARDDIVAAAVNFLGDKTPKSVGERAAIVIPAEVGFSELVVAKTGAGFDLSMHEHPTAVLL